MVKDYISLGYGSSSSNRSKDPNGFLHVDDCLLTKSEVNQYYGREIPNFSGLGLDPDIIYNVLRPADEIEKSISQMRGIPILDDHDDVHDAEHPKPHIRIGSLGSDISFEEPEVRGSLTFWNKDQIQEIESGDRDNLSMGYDYTASLEKGTYAGDSYEVRMNDIVWNHIALVDEGRVKGAKVSDRALDYSPEQAKVYSEYSRLSTKITPISKEEQNRLNILAKKLEVMGMKKKQGDKAKADLMKEWERLDSLQTKAKKEGNSSEWRRLDALKKKLDSEYNSASDEEKQLHEGQRNTSNRLGRKLMGERRSQQIVASNGKYLPKDEEIEPKTPVVQKKEPGVGQVIQKTSKYEATRKENEGMNMDAIHSQKYQQLMQENQKLSEQLSSWRRKIAEYERAYKDPHTMAPGAASRIRTDIENGKKTLSKIQERLKKVQQEMQADKSQTGDKLPTAGSKIGDKGMKTRKKARDAEIPAEGGEMEEEIKENRVVAGIKALLAEFDDVHEESGIDPGVTDEEQACLEKVRDFMDSFHNRGSEDQEEELEEEIPMDEEPKLGGEDEEWEDIEKAKSPTGDRALDAATIERRITAKFRAKDRALDECSEFLGSVSKARTLDSASDIYTHTLKANGISVPKDVNLSGLRGMVQMLKRSRTGDSNVISFSKPTGVDAQVLKIINDSPFAPKY